MILLLDVKELDAEAKKMVFISILSKYKYNNRESTAFTFEKILAYEINTSLREVRTYNRPFSSFTKPSKNSYYIKIRK